MRDLTKLNESILREYHPLPSVDHTLAQLAGATIFSKLDANSLSSHRLAGFVLTVYHLESVQPLNTSRNESHKF